MYVNSTTPPTLEYHVFGDALWTKIYVPSASVDAYKNADGWSDYADKIYAIED